MMQGAVAREEVELSFKRYILEKTEAFAHEPMEDLYRVNLLGQMLDRYDELQKKGLSADAALQRTLADYADIPAQMRREGFEEAGARRTEARWPQLTEEEAADYVKQSNAYTHKIAMGSALCSACVAPMMLLVALMSIYNRQDVGGMLGCVGMFGMIGMGIYCLVTAKKPKNRDQIRNGRFSLSAALRPTRNPAAKRAWAVRFWRPAACRFSSARRWTACGTSTIIRLRFSASARCF